MRDHRYSGFMDPSSITAIALSVRKVLGLAEASQERARQQQKHATIEWRMDALWDELRENGRKDQEVARAIEFICKELEGLTPHNLNPRIEAINDWVEEQFAHEKRKLEALVKRQMVWNISLAATAAASLIFAFVALRG